MLLPRDVGAPRVRTSDEALLVRGPGGSTRPHAHHWWHLVIGLDAPLCAAGPDGAWQRAVAVLTPPDLEHAVEAENDVAILFVEPDSRVGARLAVAHSGRSLRIFDTHEAATLVEAVESVSPDGLAELLLRVLGAPEAALRRVHPGIARVLAHLERAGAQCDVSLGALASIAGLSEGRFMHAFTEHVGVPLRPHVRWLRLRRAAAALLDGAPAAEAAHGAGFADAAHMTRTFRAMFGVTPSELARRSQSVQAP